MKIGIIDYWKELDKGAFESNPGYAFVGPNVYEMMQTGEYNAEIVLKKKNV